MAFIWRPDFEVRGAKYYFLSFAAPNYFFFYKNNFFVEKQ